MAIDSTTSATQAGAAAAAEGPMGSSVSGRGMNRALVTAIMDSMIASLMAAPKGGSGTGTKGT